MMMIVMTVITAAVLLLLVLIMKVVVAVVVLLLVACCNIVVVAVVLGAARERFDIYSGVGFGHAIFVSKGKAQGVENRFEKSKVQRILGLLTKHLCPPHKY